MIWGYHYFWKHPFYLTHHDPLLLGFSGKFSGHDAHHRFDDQNVLMLEKLWWGREVEHIHWGKTWKWILDDVFQRLACKTKHCDKRNVKASFTDCIQLLDYPAAFFLQKVTCRAVEAFKTTTFPVDRQLAVTTSIRALAPVVTCWRAVV